MTILVLCNVGARDVTVEGEVPPVLPHHRTLPPLHY